MSDTTPDHESTDGGETVGNPQAGAAAGGSATRGNETTPGEGLVETPQDDESRVGSEHDPGTDPADSDDTPDDDDETFDRAYVDRLRRESGDYRRRAREAETARDELRAALWRERVDRLGKLADPDDLPLDPDALDDPDAISAAVDALLTEKPHLRARRIRERVGQGEGSERGHVSLSALLAGRA